MSKNGFTLIELLAVVTIIALLSILVIPNIVGNIDKKKGEISEANMKLLASATDVYIENNSNRYAHTFESSGSTYCIPIQSLINDNVLETPFKDVTGEEIDYSKVMKAVYSDTYNTFEYDLVNASECTEFVNYVNRPELDSSMIPVIYENGKWLKADINSKWYNYSDKNWANAVYVKEQKDDNTQNSKSRYEYKDAIAGTEILESDILAYFVWIPRFRYQLFTGGAQTINIAFESTSTKKSNGMTTGQWLTHPAFTYNNQELSGIWVGKYETSNLDNNLVIKPNQTPWTDIDYNRANQVSINMTNQNNIYGLENINTHLTQNNEWAAVAYLTNSIYGINQEIVPSNSKQTGNSTSTTNNMTGIFDMSGVSKEFVRTQDETEISLGYSLTETKSWYNDTNTFISNENPYLTRGKASIFNYSSINSNNSDTSFRITLINKDISSDIYKILIVKSNGTVTNKIDISNSNETTIDIESNINSIICNNGVVAKEADGKLKISNILKDSQCNFSNNLVSQINEIDNTQNNILMLNDTTPNTAITIPEGKSVILDMNGKTINISSVMKNNGNLTIKDDTGEGIINSSTNAIQNLSGGELNLYNITVDSKVTTLSNVASSSGTININGCKLISSGNVNVIENRGSGNINITDELGRVYIYTSGCPSCSAGLNHTKTVGNYSTGNIKINGHIADKCIGTEENKTGICIYNGYGRTILNESNATGNIYIDGATIVSKEHHALSNYTGKSYVCSGEFNGKIADFRLANTGYIYYKSNAILKNNLISDTNNPTHLILDNAISCK